MNVDNVFFAEFPDIVERGVARVPVPHVEQYADVVGSDGGGKPEHRVHRVKE